MGQQQLILIVLGTIVIGIAIAIGVSVFSVNQALLSRDALVSNLNTVSMTARTYFMRPRNMGGGNLSYEGYTIPGKFRSNENGYFNSTLQGRDLLFTAISAENPDNRITAVLKSGGDRLVNWSFYGEFAEFGETAGEDED